MNCSLYSTLRVSSSDKLQINQSAPQSCRKIDPPPPASSFQKQDNSLPIAPPGEAELPRSVFYKGKHKSKGKRFIHISRPSRVTGGNRHNEIDHLVQLLSPLWLHESRHDKEMMRILSLVSRIPLFLYRCNGCRRRRRPNEEPRFHYRHLHSINIDFPLAIDQIISS